MKRIEGKLVSGHQVASGLAKNSPFAQGTIVMQAPYFLKAGLDLSFCYSGTLNIDLGYEFILSSPDFQFDKVKWAEQFPSESFSFFKCSVFNGHAWQPGYIYLPHPETKLGHFQKSTVIEVLTAKLESVHYGDKIVINIAKSKLARL